MREVVLALGSNLGDREATLQGAVDALADVDGLRVTAVSAVFETDPVGGPEQGAYLNAVVLGTTTLEPEEVLDVALTVEQTWHRTREVRWGPRTLDVDVLALGDLQLDTERLVVPHPRAHERGFVLVPWLDVDPDAIIPGHGRVEELLAAVGADGVWRTTVMLEVPESSR